MKIILLQDVKKLGKKGEVKEISDGYARNFLFPKKLAEAATAEVVKRFEAQQKDVEAKKKEEMEKTKKLAENLQKEKIIIQSESKNGKLFGSISSKDISQELNKIGYNIFEKQIKLAKPIKEIGEHEILLDLGYNTNVKIQVSVVNK